MKLYNAVGTPHGAKVDKKFRQHTFSVTEPEEKQVNRIGKLWTLYVSKTAAGTGDYVFYLDNTGADTLVISNIYALAGAASTLYMDVVTGTPSYTSGEVITPRNQNLGRSDTITATIYEDTNTTGLTAVGDPLAMLRCDTANKGETADLKGGVIVPQGQAVALRTSAATAVEAILTVSYLDDVST